jgi:hypothetical protein
MSTKWTIRVLSLGGIGFITIVAYQTDWSKPVTPDGFMTLLGGLLAFAGAVYVGHRSAQDVRKQLDAEKQASAEDRERQERAVATTIFFGADAFYSYVEAVEDVLKHFNWNQENPPVLRPAAANAFVIYSGNSGSLGSIKEEAAAGIVQFYTAAGSYISIFQEYEFWIKQPLAAPDMKRSHYSPTKNALKKRNHDELMKQAKHICVYLCKIAAVSYTSLAIAKTQVTP